MRRTLLVLLAGCVSAGGRGAGSRDFGIWQFREPVVNSQPAVVIEGTLVYQPDTTYVSYLAAPCTWDQRSSGERRVIYRCGDATFSFDRHNPLQDNSWSVMTNIMVSSTVCVARNAQGVCTRQDVSRAPARVLRSGRLRPFRP